MPRIQWSGLPPALRDHLFDRLHERKITAEDLYQLKTWRESDPEAPDGLWYKDFGSFKICAKENIQRPSCSRASLPRGCSSEFLTADASNHPCHQSRAAPARSRPRR